MNAIPLHTKENSYFSLVANKHSNENEKRRKTLLEGTTFL